MTTWKFGAVNAGQNVQPAFHGDILGDWREEVVYTNGSFNELIIFTTNLPTNTRLYTLAHNPAYRNDMTVKGYMQSHHVDYFLGAGMSPPPRRRSHTWVGDGALRCRTLERSLRTASRTERGDVVGARHGRDRNRPGCQCTPGGAAPSWSNQYDGLTFTPERVRVTAVVEHRRGYHQPGQTDRRQRPRRTVTAAERARYTSTACAELANRSQVE